MRDRAWSRRETLVAHLMVERARGAASLLEPYLAVLPSTFSTPIFYTAKELTLLKGTPLMEATVAKQQQVEYNTQGWPIRIRKSIIRYV